MGVGEWQNQVEWERWGALASGASSVTHTLKNGLSGFALAIPGTGQGVQPVAHTCPSLQLQC